MGSRVTGPETHNQEEETTMTTAVQHHNNGGNEVATQADAGIQTTPSRYSLEDRDRLRALQDIGEASDADLANLFAYADKTGLDPFNREIWLIGRRTKLSAGYRGGQEQWGTKWTMQIGIDGFRKATHRYAESRGKAVKISIPTFYDSQGNARPFWVRTPQEPYPTACSVTVGVGDSEATHIVTWDEYVQTKDEYSGGKKTGRKVPNSQWETYGPTQLSKCAEAGAHRRVAPITAGLYVPEEIKPEPVRMESTRLDQDNAPDNPTATNAMEAVTRALGTAKPVDAEVHIPAEQPQREPATAPRAPEAQAANVSQGVEMDEQGYPILNTGDVDNDLRAMELINTQIKTAPDHNALQAIANEHLHEFSGIHNQAVLHSLDTRDKQVSN